MPIFPQIIALGFELGTSYTFTRTITITPRSTIALTCQLRLENTKFEVSKLWNNCLVI